MVVVVVVFVVVVAAAAVDAPAAVASAAVVVVVFAVVVIVVVLTFLWRYCWEVKQHPKYCIRCDFQPDMYVSRPDSSRWCPAGGRECSLRPSLDLD